MSSFVLRVSWDILSLESIGNSRKVRSSECGDNTFRLGFMQGIKFSVDIQAYKYIHTLPVVPDLRVV
jgi:hypothetical protein